MPCDNRYGAHMFSGAIRRISASLLALVLAVGLVVHGIGVPDMIAKSDMLVANDMAMPGDSSGQCDGCPGHEKGLLQAACAAFCSSVIALPATGVVLYAVPAERLAPAAGHIALGRSDPPDPYPPRPIVLI